MVEIDGGGGGQIKVLSGDDGAGYYKTLSGINSEC